MRSTLVVAIALAGACGGKQAEPAPAAGRDGPPPGPWIEPPSALPAGTGDGAIGPGDEFLGAADDGSWVLLCRGGRLRVVVGDGPGVDAERPVATTDRDLLVIDSSHLVHVDVVARTRRVLGPSEPAAIDDASRRIVHLDGTQLIVRDPGLPPRALPAPPAIGALWSRSKRWLEIATGDPPTPSSDPCATAAADRYRFADGAFSTIDLDPSGVEAIDRVGPELGVTATGEITLDGAVVVDADCVGTVIAALADPPRAYVMCAKGRNHVVGPGFDQLVGGYGGESRDTARIADHLILGERVVCVSGACIDLVAGRDFGNVTTPLVWVSRRAVVRRQGAGLVLDELDGERRTREIALPRVTQAVTVDTATGRRHTGPAPIAPAFIDGAGDFLLYGRYVIDVDRARVIATLGDDAIAIDRTGRVLVPAADGTLRWRRP